MENLINVTYEKKTMQRKEPKNIEISLAPVFPYVDENGQEKSVGFYDKAGNSVSITLPHLFDLGTEVGKKNYNSLKTRIKYDPEFKAHVRIHDENVYADEAIEEIEYQTNVQAAVMALRSNGDTETLNYIHRTLLGSVVGLTEKVVYRHIMDMVREDAKSVERIIKDADKDYKSLILRATEGNLITLEMGVYKNAQGSILASDMASMVFYLKGNEDFKNNLAAILAGSKASEPVSMAQIEAAKALVAVTDDYKDEEVILHDETESVSKTLSEEQIVKIVDKAIEYQAGISTAGVWHKIEAIQMQKRSGDLYEFMKKNPGQALILKELVDRKEAE